MNFFGELKRRNVYKVAIAYAVVGWLIVQVATQVFPFFEIPNWAVRLVVLLIVAGFPVAIIIAWAFELTPEGIKRTEAVRGSRPERRSVPRAWIYTVLVAGVVSLGLFVLGRSSARSKASAPAQAPAKSIAVMPFENLSEEKANAYFADGIQDEIITALSRISGLRVISRTSTANYKSKPGNLSEIARELHVANILEGSVQKLADRVHINVQLIQADNDTHLWAQSYDRQLIDVFGVEAEVAKSIAESLRTTLSPEEKERLEARPTNNPDAYVLYLRARQYQTRPDTLLQDFQNAAQLYERAIALDPGFALAHAQLSATTSAIYHWFQPTEVRKEQARTEAAKALQLQPNLGEAHLARGLYLYYCEMNYAGALQELKIAGDALPNNGDVGLYVAAILRRQGRLNEAIQQYNKAEALDPRNSLILEDAAQTYFLLRDWAKVMQALDHVLILSPDSVTVKIQRGYTQFFQSGSTTAIKAILADMPIGVDPDGTVTYARWDVSLIDRDGKAASDALRASPLETLTTADGSPVPKSYLEGCADFVRGDMAKARAEWETARPTLEKTVEDSPADAARHAHLGLLYALMGRKDNALREGRRAVELKPMEQDAVDGAMMQAFLALIYARLGLADEAIPLIEQGLLRPGGVNYASDSFTLADLRSRWEWDPIRNDARFQRIVQGPEPKTNYK